MEKNVRDDDDRPDWMRKAARLRAAFDEVFGADGASRGGIHVVRAPGRVNLIGEHTDYNDGFVLPAAIDRDVLMAVRARADRRVRVYSLDYRERVEVDLDRVEHDPAHPWSNYLRGTLSMLGKKGLPLLGMDMVVTGEVPQGAGLSSSAALETATAVAARAVSEFELQGPELALACQAAENHFVGVNCGIMDQFASALGRAGNALFIDCRSYEYELVPVPAGYRIVICDSGVRRGLRDSEYNLRRAQCEEALRLLQQDLPHIRALRDVSPEELALLGAKLPEEVRKRATHIILENERVLRSVEALRDGRVSEFGRLMGASHVSLRDLFEVSCPELDVLVEIASGLPGVAGARMTGGGFGGCTVNLVQEDLVDDFSREALAEYARRADPNRLAARPQVYVCRAEDGAGEILDE
ncbi:MAG: galactokinase [Firmicutes bacterium]|nr:galactokinase [Bacillota bacterium]